MPISVHTRVHELRLEMYKELDNHFSGRMLRQTWSSLPEESLNEWTRRQMLYSELEES